MSGDVLFDDAELFSGDPLDPDLDQVCPPSVVASLTPGERRERVTKLVEQAHFIIDSAWEQYGRGRKLAATCVLYSGGNDSTVLMHLCKTRANYAVHCNTTIGVEDTRRFVRDTCKEWDIELLERVAPITYRELVLERGFPGPGMHFKMFQRLKERALDSLRKELRSDPRKEALMYIAGRRRAESKRRQNIPAWENHRGIIWASPLVMWTKLDMNTYRSMAGDVPVNPVSEKLHMSGECLCGSFASRGELDEIRLWYPDTAAEIDQLEADVRAAGHGEPFCRWGHGQGKPSTEIGPLCTSCNLNQLELWEAP